ncbi:hypothetical protein MQE23_00010 [Streptomyces sp. HP-A2021]|uniref:hypothetical protein n=1 Tax=Streptomyces sp. HP-A2021 TaxID=2927875 RepID=UPI001FAF8E61|nr:hypothetical protein [Streptomyces sp. HP-A2021]UOB07598.1 hypothetical protein MQE23_00010 [Streptomyces sp. HP-A2021]
MRSSVDINQQRIGHRAELRSSSGSATIAERRIRASLLLAVKLPHHWSTFFQQQKQEQIEW